MTTQAQPTEERLSKLEGVYEQVNERLRDLTQGQDSLREEIRQGDAAIREEMNSRFNDLAQAVRDVDANLRAEIRQTALRAETDARFNDLAQGQDALRSEANTRFNIMLVLIGGVWATMVGGFIALFTML